MSYAPHLFSLIRSYRILSCAAVLTVAGATASASSFSVGAGENNTTAQTLGTGAGQTGTVAATGTLSVSGSTIGVTITATSGTTTVTNSGSMLQTGTGRLLNNTSGTSSIFITNNSGALMRAADADAVRGSVAGSRWTINNSGIISSLNPSLAGNQAIDLDAITTGTVTINNFSGGQILAFAADAIRPGANAVITNAGTIAATLNPADASPSSDGIDSQARSGLNVTNSGLISGRHGITGGPATSTEIFTTTVTNNSGGTIQGLNGSGINIDGFNANQTAIIINHGTITGNGTLANSDGDGIDVDGLVSITNDGIIRSINANSTTTPAQSEGISVGGGTITNSGLIEGLVAAGNTNAVGRGISFLGNDITSGALAGTREAIYGNAVVNNNSGGIIRGDSDSGIAVDGPASGFTVTINNNSGATIQGGGTANAAIRTGFDNDTITNSGTIDGSSSGKAVDMGAGNDTLNHNGGTIMGAINGGSGINTLNLGAGASHNSATQNFQNVNVAFGSATLGGVVSGTTLTKGGAGTLVLGAANTYSGTTTVAAGRLVVNNVTGSGTGSGPVIVQNGATLGGTGIFSLATAATQIDVQSGATLHIGGGQMTVENGSLNGDGLFLFDLNGPVAGTAGGYDQLLFSLGNIGAVTLGSGSSLQLNLSFAPMIGQQFALFNLVNSGTFINGTFAGLGEGTVFTQGGTQFQISYLGGTGNDLVVTAIPEPSATAAALGLFIFAGALAHRSRRRQTVASTGAN